MFRPGNFLCKKDLFLLFRLILGRNVMQFCEITEGKQRQYSGGWNGPCFYRPGWIIRN